MRIQYPKDNYVIFDFETTGFKPEEDEVIQMSAIKFINGKTIKFNEYVNIGKPIPTMITDLTGITNSVIIQKGLDPAIAWKKFFDFITGYVLIGHNSIAFDKSFLEFSFKKYGFKLPINECYIDTAMMYKARKLKEGPKYYEDHYSFCLRIKAIKAFGVKYKLTLCCDELMLHTENLTAHQSDSDCEMTNLVYLKLIELYE